MKWYGFEQKPRPDGSYVYDPDNGISRFVFAYHHSGVDMYEDYLTGYGEVYWDFVGSTQSDDAIKNFYIGEKILPNGSYEMFAHDEFGRVVGFYKDGKSEFVTDGYGMEVSLFRCGEIFPVDETGLDEFGIVSAPSPNSDLSKNKNITVNSSGLRVYVHDNKSLRYKMLWSKDRETLEELREEVQQLQDNIKDLLEEIDEKVMFS